MSRPATAGKQEASKATVDLVAFNCPRPRCSLPLKPPVYQCAAGNLVCSSCYDESRYSFGFGLRSSSIDDGGYTRCYTVERMLESVRVLCSNTSRGCAAMTPYHRWADHEDSCPHSTKSPGLNSRWIPNRSFQKTTAYSASVVLNNRGWCVSRAAARLS